MADKCPACGHEPTIENFKGNSNAERYVDLRIPEQHWAIFKMMFHQMNNRFGMMGLGEFANLLPGYEDKLPLDQSKFRYVDDVAFSYVFLAMENGYRVKTYTETGGRPDYDGIERLKVFAELSRPDQEKAIPVMISDCAYEDVAKYVCEYLEEASERFAPMSGLETGPSSGKKELTVKPNALTKDGKIRFGNRP